jgi:IS5 family transposase
MMPLNNITLKTMADPQNPSGWMVGLLLLKQLEKLSDGRVVLQFKRNPYYQYVCGYSNYIPGMPCNATDLVHFRKRIGVKGFNLIFKFFYSYIN